MADHEVSYPLSSREWTFVGAPSETVEEREWRKRVTTGVAQSGNVSYQDGGTSSWQEAGGAVIRSGVTQVPEVKEGSATGRTSAVTDRTFSR